MNQNLPLHVQDTIFKLSACCALIAMLVPLTGSKNAFGQNSQLQKEKKQQNQKLYETSIGKFEVSIVPDKYSMMLGEPTSIEIRIKNHSSHDLFVVQGGDYRNRLGRPDSYKVRATGPDQKELPVIDAGLTLGGVIGPRKISKPDGWSRKLFLPNWFTLKKDGPHVIRCQTKLRISRVPDYTTKPNKDAIDVEVDLRVPIVVKKVRMTEMTQLINSIGKKAVNTHDEEAIKKLLAIRDEQTVRFWIQLMNKPNYSLRFKALQGLSQYQSDDAIAGIKIGLNTTVAEMRGNSSSDKVAQQLVKNIRHSSAVALSRSPHPRAEEFLLGLWEDPNSAIRITVLHRLGQLKDEESLVLLEKMTRDSEQRVKDEALRYFKLRTETKNR